mmetsp:Transcript_24798/g.60351  ORF Transcript_24798/g.60351 Transcript_24798/m.60351 type:complete len:228 (-) Transcript_24798:66-749(-)
MLEACYSPARSHSENPVIAGGANCVHGATLRRSPWRKGLEQKPIKVHFHLDKSHPSLGPKSIPVWNVDDCVVVERSALEANSLQTNVEVLVVPPVRLYAFVVAKHLPKALSVEVRRSVEVNLVFVPSGLPIACEKHGIIGEIVFEEKVLGKGVIAIDPQNPHPRRHVQAQIVRARQNPRPLVVHANHAEAVVAQCRHQRQQRRVGGPVYQNHFIHPTYLRPVAKHLG